MVEAIKTLKQGGVGVLPTDTLYGLVASVLNEKAVKRVYQLKKRNPQKPCIILISALKDLDIFGVVLDEKQRKFLKKVWPGKVSVILEIGHDRTFEMSYLKPLHKTLAFRMPKSKWLLDVLKQTGPLIAPSCNPEGLAPSQSISKAKEYFDDKVDFYFSCGKLSGNPSTLVDLTHEPLVVRQGAAKITC